LAELADGGLPSEASEAFAGIMAALRRCAWFSSGGAELADGGLPSEASEALAGIMAALGCERVGLREAGSLDHYSGSRSWALASGVRLRSGAGGDQ